MANRTGIELLPYVCRIVEIQAAGGLFGRGKGRGASRVTRFREIPYSPSSPGLLTAELRQIKGLERRASVAVWGLKSRHEAFLLPPASPADLEAVARREAKAMAGPGAAAQVADGIVVGELREGGRREVGFVSVQPDELRSRLQPLVDAGFVIQRAVTPAVAHAELVRQRLASFPDAVIAVLSLNGRATALTIMRGSVVLFARELPWGHETDRAEAAGPSLDVSRFAANLASELRRSFVYLKQNTKVDVTHVLVCGDVPDIRSLTGPLMSELGIDVETLDALDGIDLSRLQDSADQFRERLAALSTAWALASGAGAAVNLLPRSTKAGSAFASKVERRHAYAAVAGVIIAAAVWGLVTWLARDAAAHQDRVRRQIEVLEPEMQRLGEARRQSDLANARLAALRAFASQGPRLAKVLEAFSRATPSEIALTTLTLEPAIGAWTLSVTGKAEGANAAAAQVTFNRFLSALKQSPLLGEPLKPPSISVTTADPEAEAKAVAERRQREAYVPIPLEIKRPVHTGPAFREIVRNGLIYRIPTNQFAIRTDALDEEERRRREPKDYGVARERLTLEPQTAIDADGLPKRRPGSVLEFTVQYEVRKVNGSTSRLTDAIERLLPFLIVVAIVTFAYFWFIQAPLNAYLRARTDLASLQARLTISQDGVARAARTAPADVQGPITAFEALVARDDKVADVTAILAKAVLDRAPADQLRAFAIETSDRIKGNDLSAPGAPLRVTAATIGVAPDPRFALFPYPVTYTPVKVTFSSTFEAIASVMWMVRDLPTTIEVKSATLTRGLPLMKMELLIWVYQRGEAVRPEQAAPPDGPVVPGGPTTAPVGPRVARFSGAEG